MLSNKNLKLFLNVNFNINKLIMYKGISICGRVYVENRIGECCNPKMEMLI